MKINFTKMVLIILSGSMLFFHSNTLQAQNVIVASCSSQIAEAFGKKVLNDFKKTTGLGVNIHIFSSQISLNRLMNGYCNIAASTIRLNKNQIDNGLVEIPICKDPLVVVANQNCSIKNLSSFQIRRIFSGKVKNWKELGGKDLPITVIVPGKNTGAYKNFIETVMRHSEIKYDLMSSKSFKAAEAINHMPGAISFIAAGATRPYPYFHMFSIDGKSPSDSNYPFFQTFSFVTSGKPSGVVKEVINYSISKRANAYMKSRGMKPLIE